jgi:hypothetical protein
MDEIVLRGMAKWPNVPSVYGWLSLDRRGNWRIKGEHVANPLVTEFMGRNYAHDEHGRWYFQNGPQRVFVDLDYAPLVLRVVSPDGAPLALQTHTGRPVAAVSGMWFDENGIVLLETEQGAGTVHDRELERLLPFLIDANGNPLPESALDELMELAQQGHDVPMWLKMRDANLKVGAIASAEVPRRFGFVARPEPAPGEEACR